MRSGKTMLGLLHKRVRLRDHARQARFLLGLGLETPHLRQRAGRHLWCRRRRHLQFLVVAVKLATANRREVWRRGSRTGACRLRNWFGWAGSHLRGRTQQCQQAETTDGGNRALQLDLERLHVVLRMSG
jgi:hypothetical protein